MTGLWETLATLLTDVGFILNHRLTCVNELEPGEVYVHVCPTSCLQTSCVQRAWSWHLSVSHLWRTDNVRNIQASLTWVQLAGGRMWRLLWALEITTLVTEHRPRRRPWVLKTIESSWLCRCFLPVLYFILRYFYSYLIWILFYFLFCGLAVLETSQSLVVTFLNIFLLPSLMGSLWHFTEGLAEKLL